MSIKDRFEIRLIEDVPPDEITPEEFKQLMELTGEVSQTRMVRRALKTYLENYAEMEIAALEDRIRTLRKLTEK